MTDAAGGAEGADRDDRLVVALVRGVHGLQGAVRVEILTDEPEVRYAPGSILHREGDAGSLTVAWSSPIADGPGWRLRFAEVTTREAAEGLKGAYLEVDVGPAVSLPRGAYYWHEVIGATVRGTDGTDLGTVRDVYRSGGAEVYAVAGGPYGEFDVPGVRDYVRIFAPRRGEIVVDVEALDLTPPKRAAGGERPRAPRRRPGPRKPKTRPASDAAVEPDTAPTLDPEATGPEAAEP